MSECLRCSRPRLYLPQASPRSYPPSRPRWCPRNRGPVEAGTQLREPPLCFRIKLCCWPWAQLFLPRDSWALGYNHSLRLHPWLLPGETPTRSMAARLGGWSLGAHTLRFSPPWSFLPPAAQTWEVGAPLAGALLSCCDPFGRRWRRFSTVPAMAAGESSGWQDPSSAQPTPVPQLAG